MLRVTSAFLLLALSTLWVAESQAQNLQRRQIVHDAEFYILAEQNGQRWGPRIAR